MTLHRGQFLGLPPCSLESAGAVIVPLPFERTVSYGKGTGHAPAAILDATLQIEEFDEETLVDFAEGPGVHTCPGLEDEGGVEDYLAVVRQTFTDLRGRLVVGVGGEHLLTYGAVLGLAPEPKDLTIVQIDAHADLVDRLDGLRWSHGTVMRRLLEHGCRIVQIGVRSLSREEHDVIRGDERIATFFAHQLPERWAEALDLLESLRGEVYLSFDVDGLDPSVLPSTGTPQPDGLSWRQAMDVLRVLTASPTSRLIGADLVEFIPSAHPPGCDIVAAKVLVKILAFWAAARQRR